MIPLLRSDTYIASYHACSGKKINENVPLAYVFSPAKKRKVIL